MENNPLLVFLVFFVLQAGTVSAAAWSTGLGDGDTVYVCEGKELTLSWNIITEEGEQIIDIIWLFHGHSDQMIAMFSHDVFFPSPSYSHRVDHVPNGGIRLSHMTPEDVGSYLIEVKVDTGSGVYTTYNRTAFVLVATESSSRTDARVEARQEATPVYNNLTHEFHVQLTCSTSGRQPPAVIWTTPSSQTVSVSVSESSEFHLLLPNPVPGGNYSCQISPDSPAARCLSRNDPVLKGATVFVDSMEARMALMETKQRAFDLKDRDLEARMALMETKQRAFDLKDRDLEQENSLLKQRIVKLEGKLSLRAAFYAQLKHDTYVADGSHVVIPFAHLNEGGAYNTLSGEFVAPVDGLYFFTATAGASVCCDDESHGANLYMMKESQVTASLFSNTIHHWDMGACSSMLQLRKGQRVWLLSYGSWTYGRMYTTFSGFLLSSD